MKYTKFIAILFTVILVFVSSCEKNLDVTNPNQPTEAQFWETKDDAKKAITAAYAKTQMQVWGGAWGAAEHWFVTQHVRSDLAGYSPGIGGTFRAAYLYNTPNTKYWLSNYWESMYQGVYASNQVIENVKNMDIDKEARNKYIGEAKFLRAYYHFHLLINFKNIPLITETPEERADYYKSPVEREKVWSKIENDLADAKSVLPNSWESKSLGRATKGSATALLGKAYLYQRKWSKAESQFKDVVNMGEYGLVDNVETLFNGSNEYSKESIFEINYTQKTTGGRTETNSFPPQLSEEGWLTIYANDYIKNLYKNDTSSSGEISSRALASTVFNHKKSDVWYFPEEAEENKTKYETYFGTNENRAFWKKYCYYDQGDMAIWQSGANYMVIRYSDVLLMLAEALNEQGKTSEAINYVNKVRNRAGVVPVENMSQGELREHIRHVERPLELGGEYMRFHDLVRWYKDDIGKLKQILREHGREKAAGNFSREDLYYPIPESEVNTNPNYE